jgi:hypothetical protein
MVSVSQGAPAFRLKVIAPIITFFRSVPVALTVLSLLVTLIWFATQPIGYTNDSSTYLDLARYLSGQTPTAQPYLFFRTPGYPLLMVLSGVTMFESFIGLLLVQAVMAFLIPLVVYKIVRLYFPRAALIAAIICIVSLTPYLESKTVMTEQSYIFGLLILVYAVALYHKSPSPTALYIISAIVTALALVRPEANGIAYLAFVFCLLLARKYYRHVGIAFVAFLVVVSAWSFWVSLYTAPISGSFSQRVPKTFLYFTYEKNDDKHNYLDPANGPASALLKDYLTKFAVGFEPSWEARVPWHDFGRYESQPQQLVESIYTTPNEYYFRFILEAVYTVAQDQGINSHDLFRHVLYETIKAHPSLLISFLRKDVVSSSVSFAGQQLFYQNYVALSAQKNFGPLFDPSNGPASKKLLDTVREFAEDYPQAWNRLEPAEIFSNYAGHPEEFIDQSILQRPNGNTWWFMWNASNAINGVAQTSGLFMAAALEGFCKEPRALLLFPDNFMTYFLGPSVLHNKGYREIDLPDIFHPTWVDTTLPQRLQAELVSGLRVFNTLSFVDNARAAAVEEWIWAVLKPVIFLTIAITFLFLPAVNREAFVIGSFILVAIIYHGLVTSIFAEPFSRYVGHILPISIVLVVISTSAAITYFRRRVL